MRPASRRNQQKPVEVPAGQASRAVLRRVDPGNESSYGSLSECVHCGKRIKFVARHNMLQVICNVYVGGIWHHNEMYHEPCYQEAGFPHGMADTSHPKRVTSKMQVPVTV